MIKIHQILRILWGRWQNDWAFPSICQFISHSGTLTPIISTNYICSDLWGVPSFSDVRRWQILCGWTLQNRKKCFGLWLQVSSTRIKDPVNYLIHSPKKFRCIKLSSEPYQSSTRSWSSRWFQSAEIHLLTLCILWDGRRWKMSDSPAPNIMNNTLQNQDVLGQVSLLSFYNKLLPTYWYLA